MKRSDLLTLPLVTLAVAGVLGAFPAAGQADGEASPRASASGTSLTYIVIESSFVPGPENSVSVVSRPSRLEIGSADSGVRLRDITWQRWGSASSTATASATTCGSGGVEGYVCTSGTVALTAARPVRFDGASYYTSVLATGIPDYGPYATTLPTKRPSMATLSSDCGFTYHAGNAVGDGEYSGGAMLGAINMSCASAWSVVRPRYSEVIHAEEGIPNLTTFLLGSFRCRFKLEGPDTEKICQRGREQFFFV
jgi:hypothetical protein